jgi:hypothetical protein
MEKRGRTRIRQADGRGAPAVCLRFGRDTCRVKTVFVMDGKLFAERKICALHTQKHCVIIYSAKAIIYS